MAFLEKGASYHEKLNKNHIDKMDAHIEAPCNKQDTDLVIGWYSCTCTCNLRLNSIVFIMETRLQTLVES